MGENGEKSLVVGRKYLRSSQKVAYITLTILKDGILR
jgi:hypothetical protein